MTEFELIEAYHGAEASWLSALGVFISIVFAYIAVAYFVGSKLTRFQVAVVSGLYSLFSLMMISALTNIYQRVVELAIEIRELNPDRSVALGGAPGFLVGLLFAAFLTGLVFMFQVRRSRRTGT